MPYFCGTTPKEAQVAGREVVVRSSRGPRCRYICCFFSGARCICVRPGSLVPFATPRDARSDTEVWLLHSQEFPQEGLFYYIVQWSIIGSTQVAGEIGAVRKTRVTIEAASSFRLTCFLNDGAP